MQLKSLAALALCCCLAENMFSYSSETGRSNDILLGFSFNGVPISPGPSDGAKCLDRVNLFRFQPQCRYHSYLNIAVRSRFLNERCKLGLTQLRATGGSSDPTDSSSNGGKPDADFPAYDGGGGDAGAGAAFRLPPLRRSVRAGVPPLTADDMTPALRARVLRVMVDAFDNLPPQEVDAMLAALWAAGPAAGPAGDTLPRLARLTEEVEAIEAAAAARGAGGLEDLEDAVRVARSRVRMSGRDADYYTGALSLDPWRLPWQ